VLADRHCSVFGPLDDLEPDGSRKRSREQDQERGGEKADAAVRRGELHFWSWM
jgi:hypothetical protein